jgi:hypothetical protein
MKRDKRLAWLNNLTSMFNYLTWIFSYFFLRNMYIYYNYSLKISISKISINFFKNFIIYYFFFKINYKNNYNENFNKLFKL